MRAVKDSLGRSLQERHENWQALASGWAGENGAAGGIISATPYKMIVHSMVNKAEEIAMKKFRCSLLFVVGMLAVVGLLGCSQETPAEKAKAAAASGSAATQAAGQAAVDAIKTPMDQARQTEGILEKSTEQTAAKIKESMP
jgi:hypothetical protein